MGILGKIKSFFMDNEEKENTSEIEKDEKIPGLEEIKHYVKKRGPEIRERIKENAEKLYEELLALLDKLEQDAVLLEKVDLSNIRANEMLKKVTETGKQDYLGLIARLVKNLKEQKEGEGEISHIRNELSMFVRYAAKSDFRTTQLIGKEVKTIREDVGEINKLLERFLEENSGLIKEKNRVEILAKKSVEKELNEKILSQIAKETAQLEKEVQKDSERLEKIEKEINEAKASEDYKKREELVKNRLEKEGTLKELEFKIRTFLDRKVLEKYAYLRLSKESMNLAKKLIEDPISAIIEEKDNEIAKVLEDVIKKIENGILMIKEPDLMIQRTGAGKNNLGQYRGELNAAKEEIRKINAEILGIKINIDSFIAEKIAVENRLAGNKSQITLLEKRQEKISKLISEMDKEMSIIFDED